MNQTERFLKSEADAWFYRNREKIGTGKSIKEDLLLQLIEDAGIKPTSILEVGCANGWRLHELGKRYGAKCIGVDPSTAAWKDSIERYPDVTVHHGMAHYLNFPDNTFDLVIYGFCLYLCEPKRLFQIVMEGDRVLRDGGDLAILDFDVIGQPHSVTYHHSPGVLSYKMNYEDIWMAHPGYTRGISMYRDNKAVILHKNMRDAFPLKEQL